MGTTVRMFIITALSATYMPMLTYALYPQPLAFLGYTRTLCYWSDVLQDVNRPTTSRIGEDSERVMKCTQ